MPTGRPTARELAIVREVDGKDRIEFPTGKVLYETAGWVSDIRVSPAGDRIAFFETRQAYDDRGDRSRSWTSRERPGPSPTARRRGGAGVVRRGKEISSSRPEPRTPIQVYAVDPLGGNAASLLQRAGAR